MSRRASGLRAWVLQRVSAVYLALFITYLLLHFVFAPPAGYGEWVAWVRDPGVTVGMLLFIVALLLHAWVGIRDVLIDYVKPLMVRVTLLTLFAVLFIASGLWSLQAIFLVHVAG